MLGMKKLLIAFVLVLTLSSTVIAKSDKVTICHAAGQADTTKFVTLTISENAVYGRNGKAGHFEENGTPRAGHEQDYFGACVVSTPSPTQSGDPTPSPTPTESPTPTPSPSPTPSETPEPTPVPTEQPTPQVPELPNTAME